MKSFLAALLLVLLSISSVQSACRCDDKMLYLSVNPGLKAGQVGQLFGYNLTKGELTSLVDIPTISGQLMFASEKSERAIYATGSFAGANDMSNIVQVDTENGTIQKLGEAANPMDIHCYQTYNKANNIGYFIIISSKNNNEVGIITSNYTSTISNYTTLGSQSTGECPLITTTEDFSKFYIVFNGSVLVIYDSMAGEVLSSSLVPDLTKYTLAGEIGYYKDILYGVQLQTNSNFSLIQIDFALSTVVADLSINDNSLVFGLNGYPVVMFSRDNSHAVFPVLNGTAVQLLVYDFDEKKSFMIPLADPLPPAINSYYLVFKENLVDVYPKHAILGVTFGYGLLILLIIAGVVFYFFRNDFGALLQDASSWALSRFCRFGNIAFFLMAMIKLVVVYALAGQLHLAGLALVSTYMELHKAMFGVFMSIFYHRKFVPIYYLLSAFSILFNFVSFCTLFAHDKKIIETDKPGVSFTKFISMFTAVVSAIYLAAFIIKIRKSDRTGSDYYKPSKDYNPILSNDYEDDDE